MVISSTPKQQQQVRCSRRRGFEGELVPRKSLRMMVRFGRAEHTGQTGGLLTCEKVDRCAWSAICGCVAVHARICLDVEQSAICKDGIYQL